MELNDTENGVNFSTIQASALNFPFITYWYENGKFWEPDDRPNSQNTAQMTRGFWQAGLPSNMRAMAVKTSFDVIVFYDSDQDARVGFEKLLWEYNPKGPIQFSTSVTWRGVDVPIPTNFTIDSYNFNPEYKEGTWLKQQRILPINLTITLRTYILHYPFQKDVVTGQYPAISTWNTGIATDVDNKISITERVLLAFAEEKAWLDADTTGYSDPPTDLSGMPEEIDGVIVPSEPIPDSSGMVELQDIAQGYFQASTDLTINEVIVDPTSITPNSFLLKWAIRPADLPGVEKIVVVVPGRPNIVITDTSISEVWITGLYPNSQYSITILFYSVGGNVKDFHISVTTLPEPGDVTATQPRRRRLGPLKGTTWGSKPVDR